MSSNTVKDRLSKLLKQKQLNGIDYVEIEDPKQQTTLRVYFLKDPFVDPDMRGKFNETAVSITGGENIKTVAVKPFGTANANWKTDTDGQHYLQLDVGAPGDFSFYTLRIESDLLDPYFDHVRFSFKAGCKTDLDCKAVPSAHIPSDETPVVIDYLAKDYESFRRALLDFAALHYPDWQERSEADFGIMFLEAMSAMADELSYYQDRVAAEAYLETATQRKSARRHARLIDYSMYEGCAARVWLALQVTGNSVEAGKPVRGVTSIGKPVVFEIGAGLSDNTTYRIDPEWNELKPHYRDESERCLPRGSREMYLIGHGLDLSSGKYILIESVKDPSENPNRQIVQLIALEPAEDVEISDLLYPDPKTGIAPLPLTRIRWKIEDALRTDFDLDNTIVCANLVPATHGERVAAEKFAIHTPPPGMPLATERVGANGSLSLSYKLQNGPLTHVAPLTKTDLVMSLQSELEDIARRAAPEIQLREYPSGEQWLYQRDLLGSQQFDKHFTLDYTNDGSVTIRFGDGVSGLIPADGICFEVTYRVGQGNIGNVPPETLTEFKTTDLPNVSSVTNPLSSQGGIEPELLTEVRRMAPSAFREMLYRAVRPEDYCHLIERDISWVSHANAEFRWTGSWLTGFVTVDPRGTDEIKPEQNKELRQLVNRYRMAGTEVYELAPTYANLDLEITVCAQPDAFRGDVKVRVLDALSSGITRSGQKAFFHPDQFTFGTPLYRSRLEAAIQSVTGVKGVRRIRVRRRGFMDFPADQMEDNLPEVFEVGRNEIIRVMNDPNWPERGSLKVHVEGGK